MSAERPRPRLVAGLLAAACVLGLALRAAVIGWGLPDTLHPDEIWILNRVLTFAKGNLNPHNFLYPTFYFYLSFLWQGGLFLVGWVAGWYHSAADFERAYFVDPTRHVIAARALTAVFGALTIPAAYRLGRRLFDRSAGLVAALFLAVAPLAVRDAHYVKLDVPVALFVTLALGTLARMVVEPAYADSRRAWLVAGMFAGLAISTQYYAAVLAVPFAAIATMHAQRSGGGRRSSALLLWSGAATIGAFLLTSPYFLVDLHDVVRDVAELHKVDIARATDSGAFSSLGTYAGLLARDAMGWPVFALSLAGIVLAFVRDWRRGVALAIFPLAYLAFLANTFPASRYMNAMLPVLCVAAGYGAVRMGALVRSRAAAPAITAGLAVVAALPALAGSLHWNAFFGQDDTRTEARHYIDAHVPADATILVQPHSVPIRRSRAALLEALRLNLGDPSRASIKFRFELEATPASARGYRPVFLGDASPADRALEPDTLYLSPARLSGGFADSPMRQLGVTYVVLERYNGAEGFTALRRLADELDHSSIATRVAEFSPYRADAGADVRAKVAPFFHNTADRMDPALERPGPIIDIWCITWN